MNKQHEIDLNMVIELMDDKYCLTYIDYRDNLDGHADIIAKCINEKSATLIYDAFVDWYCQNKWESINRIVEELKGQIVKKGYKRWEVEKFFEENLESITEQIYEREESDEIEKLIRNSSKIPVRVELLSNYDCINSHWFESTGGFCYENSYFGDMIDALNLNPQRVKAMLVGQGEKVFGRFPNKACREGKEQVSYEDFYQELINSSCGANLLTYVAVIDLKTLYDSGFELSKITIPKGNNCGIFSSAVGGGSIIEMELLQDVTIDLSDKKYPYFRMEIDKNDSQSGYSIKETYGVLNSFYGNQLTLHTKP